MHALIKFRKSHGRRRAGYYGSTWLDTLDQILERLEAMRGLFVWQTSHVRSPMNERYLMCFAARLTPRHAPFPAVVYTRQSTSRLDLDKTLRSRGSWIYNHHMAGS